MCNLCLSASCGSPDFLFELVLGEICIVAVGFLGALLDIYLVIVEIQSGAPWWDGESDVAVSVLVFVDSSVLTQVV